jgi:hypothetical protein
MRRRDGFPVDVLRDAVLNPILRQLYQPTSAANLRDCDGLYSLSPWLSITSVAIKQPVQEPRYLTPRSHHQQFALPCSQISSKKQLPAILRSHYSHPIVCSHPTFSLVPVLPFSIAPRLADACDDDCPHRPSSGPRGKLNRENLDSNEPCATTSINCLHLVNLERIGVMRTGPHPSRAQRICQENC